MATFDFDNGTVNSGTPEQVTPVVPASPATGGSRSFNFDTGTVDFGTPSATPAPVAPVVPQPVSTESQKVIDSVVNTPANAQPKPTGKDIVDQTIDGMKNNALHNLWVSFLDKLNINPGRFLSANVAEAPSIEQDAGTQGQKDQALKDQKDALDNFKVDQTDKKSVDAYNSLVDTYNTVSKTPAKPSLTDTYEATHPLNRLDNIFASGIIKGVTGGQVHPQSVAPKNFGESAMSAFSQGLGAITAIDAIETKIGGIQTPAALKGFLGEYPAVAKYALPMLEGVLKSAPAFVAYGQLDPNLKSITDRLKAGAVSIGFSATQGFLSPLPKALSVPLNGALWSGLAKLNGASDQDAAAQGVVGMFFDALSPHVKISSELTVGKMNSILGEQAVETLNKYSDTKINPNSSEAEIKKAYNEAIRKTHPDVGGSQKDASAINAARDLLLKKSPEASTETVKNTEQNTNTSKPLTTNDINDIADRFRQQPAESTATELPIMQTPKTGVDNFGDVVEKYNGKARITYERRGKNNIYISEINTEALGTNGKQISKEVLKDAVANAKEHGYTITASPSSEMQTEKNPIDKGRLTKTYENAGFVKNTDMSNSSSGTHIYEPTKSNAIIVGRHGDIPAVDDNIAHGQKENADTKLTPEGKADALKLGKEWAKEGVTHIVSSDLNRGSETANIAAKEAGATVETDKALRTWDIGKFDGEPKSEAEPELEYYRSHPSEVVPGGESYGSFIDRVTAGLKEQKGNGKTAFVLHNEILKALGHEMETGETKQISIPSEKANPVAEAAKTLPEGKSSPEAESEINTQAGFINPAEVVDFLKKAVTGTQEYIEQTNKNIEFANNTDDTLYKAQKNAEADFILSDQLLAKTKDIDSKAIKKIDEYRDALGADLKAPKLTEAEQQINDNIINPIVKDTADKRAFIKGQGVSLPSEDTNHRIVKNKGGTLDKLVEQKNKYFPKGGIKGTKGVLTKSASSLKSRTMFAATDENGNRIVVHIPTAQDENITAFEKGVGRDLGSKKAVVTPRTKEFFDEAVTPVLKQLAEDLGITHQVTNLKGNKAGLSYQKLGLVQTHIGAPERVLMHEIGHQIDEKYDLQELFSHDDDRNYGTDPTKTELRALADLRLGDGKEVKESFKKYVRNSAEKMAVMFEAYLHVPEKFQEVAPNIFEKFEEFLKAHDELKPILELDPSLSLGMKKSGGQHIAGLKGKTFVSKNGTKYTIGEATKKEIEANTNVQYYHNPIVSAILENQDITRVYRAVQILDALKESPEFKDRSFQAGEGLPPEGWKTVNLDQFRGYSFEPTVANTLNAFAQDIKSGDDPISYLTAVNNFLVSTMFLSPVKHLLNVGASAVINRGVTAWLNPMAYPVLARTTIEAIRSIVKQDEDYIKLLRAGAPLMSAKVDRAAYRENVLANLGEKIDPYAKIARTAIKVGGAITPWNWAHALTWPGNDIIIQQQIREELAKSGLTVKSATIPQIEKVINDVTKVLPSYRLPVTVRRVPRYVTKNTLLFASYRYNLVKSFFELAKTAITGHVSGEPLNFTQNADGSYSKSYFSANEWKARGKAFNKILMMAFLAAIVMPYVDKKIKELTHNNNSYLSDPGQLSVIDNVNKLVSGQINIGQYIQTMIDLPPGTKEILQQITNLDFFTGKTIITKGGTAMQSAKERLAHFATNITPYDLTQKVAGGNMTIGQLLEAQLGIHTPKGNALINILQGSSAKVIEEVTRLNGTATPPSSQDITKRPDVQLFKAQVTPQKFTEAINQFTGEYVANVAKLMDNQYAKPSTSRSIGGIMDYKNATDAQKSQMIDKVKDLTLKNIETAYGYDKGQAVTGKATFEGHTSNYGIPSLELLSQPAPDDGTVKGKNPQGDPEYTRFPLAVSDKIRDQLYTQDSYWKDNGYTKNDVQLDHIVPIEAGGTMTKNNLMLTSKVTDQLNQKFEDFLGQKYSDGTISRADAIRASVDYKINRSVSLTDIEEGRY